jgi:lichenan operon transcriptional antiterminator
MDHQYDITTFDKTEYDVINFLLHSYDYVTANEIAANCDIPLRNLRSRINSIRERIESYGCTLSSIRSRGYRIPDSRSKLLLKQAFNKSGPGTVLSDGDRTDAIISLLLKNDDHYFTMNMLADKLYVSRSTINHDLIKVNEKLAEYNLSIEAKARCGLQLKGSEISKRKLLLERSSVSLHDSGEIYQFLDLFMNPQNGPEYRLLNVIRRSSIHMTDLSMSEVLLYILIANHRMISGKFIEREEDNPSIPQTILDTASETIRMMSFCGGYTAYPGEISNLAAIIAARVPLHPSVGTNTDESYRILRRILELIYDRYRFKLDSYFQRSFMLPAISYTLAMLRRPEPLHKIDIKSIKDDFPFPYRLAEATGQAFLEESGLQFDKNNYLFFTAMYRNEIVHLHHPPRCALLVCGYGSLAAENVRFLVERGISFLKITDTCMYSELDDKNLNAYDLIISTMPISRSLPLPVINITPFVTNDDLDKIKDQASWVRQSEFIPQMYFRPELFLSFTDKTSLHAAVKETALELADTLEIEDAEQFMYDSINHAAILPNGIVLAACQGLNRQIPMIFGFVAKHSMVMQDQKVYLVIFIANGKYEGKLSAYFADSFKNLSFPDVKEYAETNPDYPHLLDLLNSSSESAAISWFNSPGSK